MATCKECLHNGVCSLWRAAEGQDASNYTVGGGCREFLDQSRLPEVLCRAGDTVWYIAARKVKEATVQYDVTREGYTTDVWLTIECNYDECEECPFAVWKQSYDATWHCWSEHGEAVITADEFGKRIFRTREEAENALNQMKGEINEY